jgi:hypothetical protein
MRTCSSAADSAIGLPENLIRKTTESQHHLPRTLSLSVTRTEVGRQLTTSDEEDADELAAFECVTDPHQNHHSKF